MLYKIKVINDTYETDIYSSANIDGDQVLRLNNGGNPKPSMEVFSSGNTWLVLETNGFVPDRFYVQDHDAGQESEAFSGRTFERRSEFFAFSFFPTIETTGVQTVEFVLSGNTGIGQNDLEEFRIRLDENQNGVIDGTEITEFGGAPTLNMSSGNLVFTGDFVVGGNTDYILIGDAINLLWQDALTVSLGSGNVYATKPTIGSTTSASHITPYSLLIEVPLGGQEENTLANFPTSASDQEFFAFRLDPNGDANNIDVTQLVFELADVTGWSNADLTDVQLFIDTNAHGTLDPGETTTVGGSPTININGSTGNIVFTTTWTVTPSGNDLILRGDFANLDQLTPGDAITVRLSELNMSAGNVVFGGASDLVTSTVIQSVGGDTQLYYASTDAPADELRQLFFNDTTGSWDGELNTMTGNTTVHWVVNQLSRTSQNQFIATQSENGGTARLDMMLYDGTSYSLDWSSAALQSSDKAKRLFDMEVEALTGNALIVFSEEGSDLKYRKYEAGSWSAAADVFGGSPPTGG